MDLEPERHQLPASGGVYIVLVEQIEYLRDNLGRAVRWRHVTGLNGTGLASLHAYATPNSALVRITGRGTPWSTRKLHGYRLRTEASALHCRAARTAAPSMTARVGLAFGVYTSSACAGVDWPGQATSSERRGTRCTAGPVAEHRKKRGDVDQALPTAALASFALFAT